MYKDKDKQRQAVREAVRRHRSKGITGITEGMGKWAKLRGESVIPAVIPKEAPVPPKVEPKAKPVPDWRVEKDRQMAEFVKRYGK